MAVKLDKNFDATKATKNLARGYKFVPHLERFFPTWDEQGFTFKSEPKLKDDAWHPSGDCTPRLNALYHKALEHPTQEKVTPTAIKAFMVGHFWHQWLQWIVVEKLEFAKWDHVEHRGAYVWGEWDYERCWGDGPTYIPSQRLSSHLGPRPFHWATGSADIAPVEIPKHGEFLIDFKTMNHRHFAAGKPPDDYGEKWECQVNIYMDFFNLERALVIGIGKDTPHDFLEFEYHRNQPLIDSIYDKWGLVSDCLDEGVAPPENAEWPLPLRGPSR